MGRELNFIGLENRACYMWIIAEYCSVKESRGVTSGTVVQGIGWTSVELHILPVTSLQVS